MTNNKLLNSGMGRAAFALLTCVMTAGGAQAQSPAAETNWPDRNIRLIVPFPAGSSTDVVGRILAQKLGARLGQQIVVENRAGASGNIGVDAVAKAAPDGYTIGLVTGSTHALAPALGVNQPYDPIKDFKPIGMIGEQPYALIVSPAMKVHSVAELIARAKEKPGTINYGSAGPASVAHLAGTLFATLAGIEINHVPYKTSAQSVVDLMTGRLDMQFSTIAPTLSNVRSGQLLALATTGAKRATVLPDVQTMREAGVGDYEASLWMAVMAPAATPTSIVSRLNGEVSAILAMPDIKEALAQQGLEPEPGPPEKVIERIRSETEKWRDLVRKTGIRAE
jgi:tripartite-type tricarboxylate transporter receptor subunit TctC